MFSDWTRQEPGFYLHPTLGGICRERDSKWYWYPAADWPDEMEKRRGPLSSLKKAIALADLDRGMADLPEPREETQQ